MHKNFAAMDIGTNSSRLLVANSKGEHLYRDAISVRLGEGLCETGMICDESMERAVNSFVEFRKVMDLYGVSEYRAIATEASRVAANSVEFLQRVKEASGIDIEIIDGEEEAKINLAGAILNADKNKKYVALFDIGGGSTEITLATNSDSPQIIKSISIPLGSRTSAEKFDLKSYDKEKVQHLDNEISGYVEDFIQDSDYEKYREDTCVVASSSSALRIAAIAHGMEKYSRQKADGMTIVPKDLSSLWKGLKTWSVDDMKSNPLVGEGRANIFVSACTIFTSIASGLKAEKITASLKSANDGIIQNFVNKEEKKHGAAQFMRKRASQGRR